MTKANETTRKAEQARIVSNTGESVDLPPKSSTQPTNASPARPVNEGGVDPLLQGLTTLMRLRGATTTIDKVLANLPCFRPGKMPLPLFLEGAGHAGLQARLVKQPLHAISSTALPVLLLLKNDNACILTELSPKKASIILPEAPDTPRRVSPKKLSAVYTGHAVYTLLRWEDHTARETAVPIKKPRSSHWLWGPIINEWRSYAQVILASLLMNLFALATPLYVKNIYDRVIPHNSLDTLAFLTAGLVLVFLFDFVLKLIRARFVDTTGKKIDMRLETAFYNKILNLKAGASASSGSLVNTLRELEMLRDFFTSATLTTFVDLPFVVIFILLFAYIGGPIALLFLLSIPIILLVALIIHYPMQRCVEKSYAAGTQKHSILIETISNFEVAKALLCAPTLRTRWNGNVGESAKQSINIRTLSMASTTFTGLVQQFSYAGIFIVGVYLLGKGELTVGGLVACSILSGRITGPLLKMSQLLTQMHHTLNSYRELNKIMQLDEERPPERHFLHRSELTGAIALSRVEFCYPEISIPVLDCVNLNIRAGEKVGIIGRTGSGKTTLGKLLLGLYEPKQGAVLMDGTDMRQIDPLDSRRHIGYVPQDPGLFRGTVKSNIKIGHPSASDHVVLQAATLAGVTAFLNRHPLGFDLPIYEQGGGLSGGQRQAVAIARALVGDPKILVMDEPTSAMDNRSEAMLIANLRPWLAEKTLVLATHKESLLALVDRIVILDNGKVVADGPKNLILTKLCSGNIQVQKPQ